jgi:hypothetical protein
VRGESKHTAIRTRVAAIALTTAVAATAFVSLTALYIVAIAITAACRAVPCHAVPWRTRTSGAHVRALRARVPFRLAEFGCPRTPLVRRDRDREQLKREVFDIPDLSREHRRKPWRLTT